MLMKRTKRKLQKAKRNDFSNFSQFILQKIINKLYLRKYKRGIYEYEIFQLKPDHACQIKVRSILIERNPFSIV